MTKGKIAAQCSSVTCFFQINIEARMLKSSILSHATLACYKALVLSNPTLVRHWERTGQAKIALKIDSEDELLLLQASANSLGLCARKIQDA